MRRFCIILFTLLGIMTTATAGIVTESEALKKAEAFLSTKGGTAIKNRTIAKANPYRAACKKQQADASYYVFNIADNGGFVIVSGDDSTEEILGYADSGSFDANNIPTNMAAWLQGYADQIEEASSMAASNTRQVSPQKVATHPAIEPLVKTKWNQGPFSATGNAYNYQTPLVKDYWTGEMKHAVTGCVATAMAQIMNYHQWPNEVGAIDEYQYQQSYSGTTVTVPAIPATTFDWANMLNKYDGSEDAEAPSVLAISTLMRYCGQAAGMMYGEGGESAAYSKKAAEALKNTFGYDDAMSYVSRSQYTISTWDELIYNELSAQRPVYYDGSSSNRAHAVVCDGYDGGGFYHINWGWGGYCDGYFKLSVMNPYSNSGTGASSSRDGYSMDQGAIIGIRPNDGIEEKTIIKMTAVDLRIENGNIVFNIWNRTGDTHTFDFGIGKLETDGNVTCLSVMINNWKLKTATGKQNAAYPIEQLSTLSLDMGKHRIVPISKASSAKTWYNSCINPLQYIEVEVDKSGTVISSTVFPVKDLEATNFTFLNAPYAKISQEIVVTIQNKGNEFNDVLYLFDANNDKLLWGKTGFAIEEGATDNVSFFFTPEEVGTYDLKVTTDETATNVIGKTSLTVEELPIGEVKLEVVSEEFIKGAPIAWSLTLKNNSSIPSVQPIKATLYVHTSGNYYTSIKSVEYPVVIEPESTATVDFSFDNVAQEDYLLIIHNLYYKSELSLVQEEVARKQFHYEPYTLNVSETLTETLVLPFEALIPEGTKIYTLEYLEAKDAILATEVTTSTISAYQPVLVMVKEGGRYIFISQEGKASTNPANPSTYGALTGVYEMTTVPSGSYQLTSNNGNPTFVAGLTTTVEANRAYLTTNNEAAREILEIYFDENNIPEPPTAINTVNRIMEDGDIYTLQGVKVTGALKRGVYIKNGVKFVVK